ncbi:MAG: cytochrome c3 family protein [Planctomycetota bacterium]|jgi:predicted CXXCH cytochrome family protein
MQTRTGLRAALPVGLILLGLGLGYAATEPDKPAAKSGDGVIFPPDRAVLLSGGFDVICKINDAKLTIDGEPVEWEAFEPPVHVARVRLTPGVHELEVGGRKRQIVVALNEEEHDGPEDWSIHRSHPIETGEDRCADCHQTEKKDGRIVVGEIEGYEACFECHTSVDFDVTHSHPLEPIENCESCHSLHASDREMLLKAPAKELCADCHDA